MKNFKSYYQTLSLMLLAVVLLHSCKKDESITPETTNTLSAEQLAEADRISQSREQGMGAIFSTKEEYAKVPNATTKEWKSIRPESIERSSYVKLPLPPVISQGNEGSCTAFGTGYAVVSYYLNRLKGLSYSNSGALRSPEFLFNMTRGTSDCSGANLRNVLNYLVQTGVCSWNDMPYTDKGCATRPGNTAFQNAWSGKIKNYYNVTSGNEAKYYLSQGFPVVIAFGLDQAFNYQTEQSPYTWSFNYGNVQGGHVSVVVGYDDANRRFIVQNSWGTNRHDKGFFYISYDFYSQAVREAYVLEPVW